MKVHLIAGARPNFMKIAPIYRSALTRTEVDCRIVHTGQHYDFEMSQAFFEDLELPEPHYFLNAGSGSHAVQTARIMTSFEEICLEDPPDLVIVVGDVNSTLACSITAKKLGIQVAHVEAGLRSFDLAMPEEINRMVTDAVSDYFFVTEESGLEHLRQEGKSEDRIYLVGNVMIDNLLHQVEKLKKEDGNHFPTSFLKKKLGHYAFLTLHRPSNVDHRETFKEIASALNEIADRLPLIFPAHPRTQKMIESYSIELGENINILPPLAFKESLFLWKDSIVVLTDSGGLQEETTALGIPCVTIRENTERPITIDLGTNVLAGTQKGSILAALEASLDKARTGSPQVPPLWDGQAAQRIWNAIIESKETTP